LGREKWGQKKQIKGVIHPMIIPFKANGDVDYDKHIFCLSARTFALCVTAPFGRSRLRLALRFAPALQTIPREITLAFGLYFC
jgi:hypothetical protein